jgi:hypothetical protein
MRRIPWDILLALLVGLGLGLVYSWILSPKAATNTTPRALRADFKDEFRSVIAAAYAATGNLPAAQARLSLLGDPNSIEALNAQAQRMLASNQPFERADQVAALASALEGDTGQPAPPPTATVEIQNSAETVEPVASSPPATDLPIDLTETPQIIETATSETVIVPTPRPTHTAVPTQGAPFKLTGQENVCDSNLPDGLLQVLVLSSNRRQIAGVEIAITWDGGKESFFTGLKPELGNGYADYTMAANTTYAVQLARGSDVAVGITAPTCQTPSGETFLGSIKLTFQQP